MLPSRILANQSMINIIFGTCKIKVLNKFYIMNGSDY